MNAENQKTEDSKLKGADMVGDHRTEKDMVEDHRTEKDLVDDDIAAERKAIEEDREPETAAKTAKAASEKPAEKDGMNDIEAAAKAKAIRVEKIKARSKRLYNYFKKAGFNRDSFVELGESCKADVPFEKLHPVVAKNIMKIAASQIDSDFIDFEKAAKNG